MLLMLIEQEYKLDEVIFCDLGKEFKAIYNIRDKAKKILEEKNIKYTELNLAEKFNNLMLEKDVKKRNGTTQKRIWNLWWFVQIWNNTKRKRNV